jgi:hypothetical protein
MLYGSGAASRLDSGQKFDQTSTHSKRHHNARAQETKDSGQWSVVRKSVQSFELLTDH